MNRCRGFSVALLIVACSSEGDDGPNELRGVRFTEVATGFVNPTDLQFVPGQDDVLVVLQQQGVASWASLADGDRGELLRLPVFSESESGLLGLAFHPDFPEDRRIFVSYVVAKEEGGWETRISEFTVAEGPPLGAARDERLLLALDQPATVHKGGQLAFGPDDFLYISLGDGGGDPSFAQDPGSLYGKILRIDVDRRDEGLEYAVPEDNPFVGTDARPEVWALGFRNPWRFSFDPEGRLIASDVGHQSWEEIDLVEAGSNYGWPIREGAHCYAAEECPAEGLVDPIYEYPHSVGTVVTGGYVYLGERIPELQGQYVFTDFATGVVTALTIAEPAEDVRELGSTGRNVAALGRDAAGELYFAAFDGAILRLDALE